MKTKLKQLLCRHDYKFEGCLSEQWRLGRYSEVKVVCVCYLCTKCNKVKFENRLER